MRFNSVVMFARWQGQRVKGYAPLFYKKDKGEVVTAIFRVQKFFKGFSLCANVEIVRKYQYSDSFRVFCEMF
jgi:hypothetical protein